jgi:uncharacterized protein (TIGR02145 family)
MMKTNIYKWLIIAGVMLVSAASCTDDGLFQEKSAVMIYGTMKDQDSNTYKTVKIGNQVWMAENLRTTKYSDGTPIPNITDDKTFHYLNTGACCNYNNETANGETYGHLYNWFAVSSSHKIAPEGWHVPTEKDWATLSDFLGGDNVAGGKLKETGTSHWTAKNIGASDMYGFTALPGGTRAEEGQFSFLGTAAYWWSATQGNDKSALLRGCANSTGSMLLLYYYKEYGFSVRLIKD